MGMGKSVITLARIAVDEPVRPRGPVISGQGCSPVRQAQAIQPLDAARAGAVHAMHARTSMHHGGTIIVVPLSLLSQWRGEIQSKTSLSLCVHAPYARTGAGAREREHEYGAVTVETLAASAIVLTTFSHLRPSPHYGAAGNPLYGVRWRR